MTVPPPEAEGSRGVEPRNPAVAVVASVIVHSAIAAALVAMGVTAARAMRREAPPLLVADWTPPPPPGVAPAAPELPVPGGAPVHTGPAARARTDPGAAGRSAADRLARAVPPPSRFESPGLRLGDALGLGGQLPPAFRSASFALDRSRVAFVVDGGGRMLAALPAARAVLAQRLSALVPDQRFTVAVARGSGTELAPGTPAFATRGNVAAALRWFTERAAPGGTANLADALERSWAALDPDAVCVIARGNPSTRRAAARSATDGLLAAAERLNPAAADGRRAAAFLCVELVDRQADSALATLGESHGGASGYLLLDRAALGLSPGGAAPAARRP
jgi:hypothetical protein